MGRKAKEKLSEGKAIRVHYEVVSVFPTHSLEEPQQKLERMILRDCGKLMDN